MKILAAVLLIPVMASAEKPYFQQDVSYDIKVELDPETAILAGIENITYVNNMDQSREGLMMLHEEKLSYVIRGCAYEVLCVLCFLW